MIVLFYHIRQVDAARSLRRVYFFFFCGGRVYFWNMKIKKSKNKKILSAHDTRTKLQDDHVCARYLEEHKNNNNSSSVNLAFALSIKRVLLPRHDHTKKYRI